jgi:hypothetical protein
MRCSALTKINTEEETVASSSGYDLGKAQCGRSSWEASFASAVRLNPKDDFRPRVGIRLASDQNPEVL